MLNIQKYAAIDIGSNAVRLLISNIVEERDKPTRFKKKLVSQGSGAFGCRCIY